LQPGGRDPGRLQQVDHVGGVVLVEPRLHRRVDLRSPLEPFGRRVEALVGQ
jgi:hypothetical protein